MRGVKPAISILLSVAVCASGCGRSDSVEELWESSPAAETSQASPASAEATAAEQKALLERASALIDQGKPAAAIELLEPVAANSDDANLVETLGWAYQSHGELAKAADLHERAIKLDGGQHRAMNNLAWLLATRPSLRPRSDDQAVVLAERAAHATNYLDPYYLDTLAVAHAANGRFEQAMEIAARACQRLRRLGDTAGVEAVFQRFRDHAAGLPPRERASTAASEPDSEVPPAELENRILPLLASRTNSRALLARLAWIQATHDQAEVRNGPFAQRLAAQLVAQDDQHLPSVEALAAAEAECGNFERAQLIARRALTLAEARSPTDRERIASQLTVYEGGLPFRVSSIVPWQPSGASSTRAQGTAYALYILGEFLLAEGSGTDAVFVWRSAIDFDPCAHRIRSGLATLLLREGRLSEAARHLLWVLAARPADPDTLYLLGWIRQQQGRVSAAVTYYTDAVQLPHVRPEVLNNLAWLLATQPAYEEKTDDPQFGTQIVVLAQRACEAVQNADPTYLDTLAAAQAKIGDFHGATETIKRARQLAERQENAQLCTELEQRLALYQNGKPYRAVPFDPRIAKHVGNGDADMLLGLGWVCQTQGRFDEAVKYYAQAIERGTPRIEAVNNLAWLLATRPDSDGRYAKQAIDLAERVCKATHRKPMYLDTLAAAYADDGRFIDAAAAVGEAIDALKADNQHELARPLLKRLELYQSGKAYREQR